MFDVFGKMYGKSTFAHGCVRKCAHVFLIVMNHVFDVSVLSLLIHGLISEACKRSVSAPRQLNVNSMQLLSFNQSSIVL